IGLPRGLSPLSKISPSSCTRTLLWKNREATKKKSKRTILHRTKGPRLILLSRPASCKPELRFLEVAHASADAQSPPVPMFGLDRNSICSRGRGDEVRRRARFPLRSRPRLGALCPRAEQPNFHGLRLYHLEYPRPAHSPWHHRGRVALRCGRQLPGVAAQSVSGPLRAGSLERSLRGRRSGPHRNALSFLVAGSLRSPHATRSVPWCRRNDRRRVFSGPPRWSDRQHDPASRRGHHWFFPFRHHHLPHGHRHHRQHPWNGFLADG